MDAAYAFTHDIQKDYFKDNEMGNFDLMTRGLTDVSTVFENQQKRSHIL